MVNNEIAIAQDTRQVIEQGHYINSQSKVVRLDAAIEKATTGTRLYTPEELEVLPTRFKRQAMATIFQATKENSLEAIRRIGSKSSKNPQVLCLNFGSPKQPSDGTEVDAIAHEGLLVRSSALRPCLLAAPQYHEYHRQHPTKLYSDYMIYTRDVPFFRDNNGELTDEPYLASIISCTAVDALGVRQQEPENQTQIASAMRIRIRKILTLSAVLGYENLVLGAWGCGPFANDPEMIAELFREKLTDQYAGCFRHIVFAIPTENEQIFQPFNKRFNGTMYYLMY
jgi:uncharacterized protein (TIGR02452 family)